MIQTLDSRAERRKLDDRLDEALRQTFPASDPVAVGHVTATEPPSRPVDARAPLPHQDGATPRRMSRQPRRKARGRAATAK